MRILNLLALDFGTSWIAVADSVVKATAIFLTAGLASVLLRRRSAALRHVIWTLALGAVLVLPLLSMAMPRWQVKLVTIEAASSSLVASAEGPSPTANQPVPPKRVREGGPTASRQSPDPQSVAPGQPTAAQARTPLSLSAILLGVWTIGALLILGRLLAGVIAVQWMSRRTERVTDAPWLAQAKSLAEDLGISRRIVFLRSRGAAMPMAWGLLRPAVLMPADADHWPAERLRIVLLHELAHSSVAIV